MLQVNKKQYSMKLNVTLEVVKFLCSIKQYYRKKKKSMQCTSKYFLVPYFRIILYHVSFSIYRIY